jgi:hypothetical protein
MKEFIDETSVENGTPINRANMMAVQGFVGGTITVNADGSIVEKMDNGETLTTRISGNTIEEIFVGQKTIKKTTQFNGNVIIVGVS